MPGTEWWLRCEDGRAVLLWPAGLSFTEFMQLSPRLKQLQTLADVRRYASELERITGKELRVAYFPRFGEGNCAA